MSCVYIYINVIHRCVRARVCVWWQFVYSMGIYMSPVPGPPYIYIYINSRYTAYCCRYSIYHIYYVKFIQRTYLPILYILHLLWIQYMWHILSIFYQKPHIRCIYIYYKYIYIYRLHIFYLYLTYYIYVYIYIYTTHTLYITYSISILIIDTYALYAL